MEKFANWLEVRVQLDELTAPDQQGTGPEAVSVMNSEAGVFLNMASGKQIGPVFNIQAEKGDTTHSRWIVQTQLGSHAVIINPKNASSIVSNFFQYKKQHDGSGYGQKLVKRSDAQGADAKKLFAGIPQVKPSDQPAASNQPAVDSGAFTHEDYAKYRVLKNKVDSGESLIPHYQAVLQRLEKKFQDAVRSGNLPS